ncbi:MAG TPA: SRPBCC family protein, partial [Acidobacteriota bacterium]|nr:SRPBCC family protein [Acidobacteriota bacterium]
MNVLNIHERRLEANFDQVGALIDTLASPGDRLWPKRLWPPMKFDRPLGVGADGGHGPIRYYVEEYTPGNSIKFRFTGPKGFDGYHRLDVLEGLGNTVVIRHTLEMKTHGLAIILWPLVFR